jgi:magnesium chelatase family protein
MFRAMSQDPFPGASGDRLVTAFILLAAMNPCSCGHFGDLVRECTSLQQWISRYQNRINGPLLDQIDIHLDVPPIDYESLFERRADEPTAAVRERVERARLA